MNGPRKRMYQLHRWTGLVLAVLGMLVFFSGAVATFHEEIEGWATRGDVIPTLTEIDGFDVDQTFAVAREGVDPRYLHQVDVFRQPRGTLAFFMHEHVERGGGIVEVGVYRVLDPRTNAVLRSLEGERDEVMQPAPRSALSSFFVELHIFLLLPRTLGLIATGIAGFGLTVLISTGVLVHRPTVNKLLRKPRTNRVRLLLGDLHTWLGSWTLPYTVVLALTGVFFSFAGTVLIPVVAIVAFDGDQEALIRTVIGAVEVSDSPDVAELDPMFRDAHERTPGASFSRLGLDRWGQDDANATLVMRTSSTTGEDQANLVYDGHTGAFVQRKPSLGTEPSLGDSLLGLMGDLHFGTLFGSVTKLLWGLFGFATCFIAGSGLLIYLAHQRDPHARGLTLVRMMTLALAGGLPLATVAASLSWVAACCLPLDDPKGVMTIVFLATLVLCGCLGAVLDLSLATAVTWAGAAAGFAALPWLGPLASGQGVLGAWASPATRATVAVDIGLTTLALSYALAALALRGWATHVPSPAE